MARRNSQRGYRTADGFGTRRNLTIATTSHATEIRKKVEAIVETVLKAMAPEELADLQIDGQLQVTCEFCNTRYDFPVAAFLPARRAGMIESPAGERQVMAVPRRRPGTQLPAVPQFHARR